MKNLLTAAALLFASATVTSANGSALDVALELAARGSLEQVASAFPDEVLDKKIGYCHDLFEGAGRASVMKCLDAELRASLRSMAMDPTDAELRECHDFFDSDILTEQCLKNNRHAGEILDSLRR